MRQKDNPVEYKRHRRHPGIRPPLNRLQRVDAFIRWLVPMAFTLFVILFFSIPLNIPGQNGVLFAIVSASIYFWSIYRPASMPAIGVFCLAFLIDLLNFSPPGIVILILLIIYGIGLTQRFRLASLNFLWVWLVFIVTVAGVSLIQWILISAFSLKLIPISYFLFEMVFAIGFYPLLSIIFTWAHRTIADPEQI